MLYLLYFASAAPLAVRTAMIVPGDAAATASHILASEPLYRLTVATDLIGYGFYIGVTFMLYELFKPVSHPLSLLAALFSFAGCAFLIADTVNLLTPLILLGGAPYLAALKTIELQALSLTALRAYSQGYNLSLFFFGCYCSLLGCLILRSTFLPKPLGVLLGIAGLVWLTFSLAGIALQPLASFLAPFARALGVLGEGLLALWLLVVGVDASKWTAQALTSNAHPD